MIQDRRIRKTRATLKSALISIMSSKSIKHITVKEICETADLNRGTFYLHYRDVYDMLEQIEDDFFNELTSIIDSHKNEISNTKEPLLEDLFCFTKNNKDFCRVMLSERGDIGFVRRLLEYLYKRMSSLYMENSPKTEHSCYFIIYGCIGLIENWLETDTNETAEEMAILASRLITNGIAPFLKEQSNKKEYLTI